jgi:uncharacterized membrane protein YfcA
VHLTVDIVAFLAGVGMVAGFIDSLAGGGGLLTLPALMAVGIPPVWALGTNKLQSCFGTGGAVLAFARKGHIDFRGFAAPVVAALAGSALGAFTVQRLDPGFLAGFVPILLVAMAIYYLVAPKMGEEDRHNRIGKAGLVAVSAVIGFYDGFFGPGTGSFLTTALVAFVGLGLVRAMAHARLLNFATNIAALVTMILGGKVVWLAGLAMACGSIIGNQIGAHTAMRFQGRGVRPLLVVMSLALTIKLLSNPANPLRAAIGW